MAHEHGAHGDTDHHHGHHHGHENDQGLKGALRYIRWFPRMWRSSINDALVGLVAPVPGEHVVDIGAGMGAGAVRAASSGAQVTAVEPTPFMRRVLKARRLASRSRSRLDVVDGTAEQMPVADDSVDAIIAVNTMHHWVDVARGVTEIARVLRPSGRLLLVDEAFNDPAHPDHERFASEGDADDAHHHGFTMVDADRMVELLANAGIADVRAIGRDIDGRPVIGVACGIAEVAD